MIRIAIFLLLVITVAWTHGAPSAKGQDDAKAHAPTAAEHSGAAPKAAEAAEHAPTADAHASNQHGGDHHAHDPLDLSHGNASAQLKAAQELRFDLAIATFVVFLGLLAILTKFAWGPISTALQRREETIARQIEEAKRASEKGEHLLREYEARLAAATEEARQIVAGARKDAESAKDRVVAEAREGAQREREKAVADITIAKNQALDQIAQKTVQTAVNLASSLIRREVKPQEHESIIGEAIGEFSKLN